MIKPSASPERVRLFLVILAMASLLPIAVFAGTEIAAVKTQTLLHTTTAWNDAPYTAYPAGSPEITVLKMTVPAHSVLPWHTHPMPNAAYIVSGEITVEQENGVKRHFTAGEVIPETVNTMHRGTVGDQPAEFIVFYAGIKDMPLSEKKK